MSFRTFIYLDKEKVDDYLLVLDEQQSNKKSKVSVRAKANFVIGEVEADLEKQAEDKRSRTAAEQYNLFENALSNTTEDDYFDFLSSDYDMSTVPPLSIIRCTGYIEIPEAFDILHMVSEFAGPMIKAGLFTPNGDPNTNEFALSFFQNNDADIPILITGNQIRISSKLKASCIIGDSYQVLEDIEDEEVFALCKIHTHLSDEKVVIFDPIKDFLKLNRAARRRMGEVTGDLEPIVENGPVLKVEVIALYH